MTLKCKDKHPRYIGTILECKKCGKKFVPPDGQYKRKYCSLDCYFDSKKGKEPEWLVENRGVRPRTYHLNKTPKHEGAEYKEWRMNVFRRDNFTCQFCHRTSNELKKIGIKICADHIKPYSVFKELRYEVSNGRTLCEPCHKTTDTYGYKARNFLQTSALTSI